MHTITVKTLIGLFDTQREPELPGGAAVGLESPAKRRRKAFTKLNDHQD